MISSYVSQSNEYSTTRNHTIQSNTIVGAYNNGIYALTNNTRIIDNIIYTVLDDGGAYEIHVGGQYGTYDYAQEQFVENNSFPNGLARYYLSYNRSAKVYFKDLNITTPYITLPNLASVNFSYNGNKQYVINTTSNSASVPNNISLFNLVSPYDDIKNVSTDTLLYTNVSTQLITLSSGQQISVGNYDGTPTPSDSLVISTPTNNQEITRYLNVSWSNVTTALYYILDLSGASSLSIPLNISSITGTYALAFEDLFNRTDSNTIGNDWLETESSTGVFSLSTNRLKVIQASSPSYILHNISFGSATNINLSFNVTRTSATTYKPILVELWNGSTYATGRRLSVYMNGDGDRFYYSDNNACGNKATYGTATIVNGQTKEVRMIADNNGTAYFYVDGTLDANLTGLNTTCNLANINNLAILSPDATTSTWYIDDLIAYTRGSLTGFYVADGLNKYDFDTFDYNLAIGSYNLTISAYNESFIVSNSSSFSLLSNALLSFNIYSYLGSRLNVSVDLVDSSSGLHYNNFSDYTSFYIVRGRSYSYNINASGFEFFNGSFTASNDASQSISSYLYPSNSVNLSIYSASTGSLILQNIVLLLLLVVFLILFILLLVTFY